jgi:hypothetical protein
LRYVLSFTAIIDSDKHCAGTRSKSFQIRTSASRSNHNSDVAFTVEDLCPSLPKATGAAARSLCFEKVSEAVRTFASTDVSSEARQQSDNELGVCSATRKQRVNAERRILVVDEDAEAKVDSVGSLVSCAHIDNDKTFEPDNADMCPQSF